MNRTLIHGDNLEALQNMAAECVDLVYLDPPFDSGKDWGEFDDRWAGDEYLIFMEARLRELHRVLKPTGSLYLHCDDVANHYLKVMLDDIFGRSQFRNEIVWVRTKGTKNSPRRYPRNLDRLLYYVASPTAAWNAPMIPWSQQQIDEWYVHRDERGRYMHLRLRAPRPGLHTWRGLSHGTGSWNAPRTGHDAEWIEREFIPGYRDMGLEDRLEALDAAGLLHWPAKEGGIPQLKRYLKHATATKPVADLWDGLEGGRGMSRTERVGYPTQKPLALLERIIKASSNEGDVVLDPFCGSGTTLVAAEQLGRSWIGIDVNENAIPVIQERFAELNVEINVQAIAELNAGPKVAQETVEDTGAAPASPPAKRRRRAAKPKRPEAAQVRTDRARRVVYRSERVTA